jgi:hypothetical protein
MREGEAARLPASEYGENTRLSRSFLVPNQAIAERLIAGARIGHVTYAANVRPTFTRVPVLD